MMHGGYGGYGLFGGFSLLNLLVMGLILYFLIKAFTNQSTRSQVVKIEENRPLEILNERYAKGEIEEAEYKKKMKQLKNS